MCISVLLYMLSHKKKSCLAGTCIFQQTFNHFANYLLSKQREVGARQPATRVCSIESMNCMNSSQEIQSAVYALLMFKAKLKFKFPWEITVSSQIKSYLIPDLKSNSHGTTGKRSLTCSNTENIMPWQQWKLTTTLLVTTARTNIWIGWLHS